MRRFACRRLPVLLLAAMVLGAWTGCANNSMVAQGQVEQYQQQQLAMSNQLQQCQQRAASLAQDHQRLTADLAQVQQKVKVYEDQATALRGQLRERNAQLAQLQAEKTNRDQEVQTLTASLRRQGGVSIRPNNSLSRTLPSISQPGVHVRRDGDVIRVELPADRLFAQGAAQLQPSAVAVLAAIGAELQRGYPDQLFGVEGHLDDTPTIASPWRNGHELSIARAMAVADVLATRGGLPMEQISVTGHGSNHPVVSNATELGKARNRRVEVVIYPEKKR